MFTRVESFLRQLKARRVALGFKQNDMLMRVGMSRQQYQRLESKGNPRLNTLELIAKGLNSEIMLIPKEKLAAVQSVLDENTLAAMEAGLSTDQNSKQEQIDQNKSLSEDPWQGLLGDDS